MKFAGKAACIFVLTAMLLTLLAGCGKGNEPMKIKITQGEENGAERIFETLENYVYIPDESVFGKWEAVDYVENIEDFVPGSPNPSIDEYYYCGNEFFDNGKVITSYSYGGEIIEDWTAGYIDNTLLGCVPEYTVESIGDENYLFVQWKSGDYTIRGDAPDYYVFKKAEGGVSRHEEIERDYEWYIEKSDEIMFNLGGSGSACALMAAKWHNGEFSIPFDIYLNEIPRASSWTLSVIKMFLGKIDVPYNEYSYNKSFPYEMIKLHLYTGNIVIADVSNKLNGFRFIIIKGIKESPDGEIFYEVYDPDSGGETNPDGSYIGKNALYSRGEVEKAANDNGKYLVINHKEE